MNSREALETLGNVKVAVTTIRSGKKHFKTLKEHYEVEFEVLERELFIRKELKDFDVYQIQLEKLEKENQQLNQTIQTIRQNARNDYISHQEEINNSKEEFDHLLDKYYELGDENTKLKKAIDYLKDNFKLKISKSYNEDGTIKYILFSDRTALKYGLIVREENIELVKEVLGNDK